MITKTRNGFINVYVVNVNIHPSEEALIVHMQDMNGNLKIVKCKSIVQMIDQNIVFDDTFVVITEQDVAKYYGEEY